MKLRFEVNQADSFRHGIDRSKSIVSIEVNPADLPEETRALIADHLTGIDVVQFFYHNGDVIKGHPIKELCYTCREPKRIVAKAVNLESLVEAIKVNDALIANIRKSFDHPIQFRVVDKPPKNENDFAFVSDQRPAQIQELRQAIRQKRRVFSDCFLEEVQNLRQELHEHFYVVYLFPLPPATASARFYFEPVFASEYAGQQIVAHSPQIVWNRKTGRVVEAMNLFQAVDIYLLPDIRHGILFDDLSILAWDHGKWVGVAPEELVQLANEVDAKRNREPDKT